MSFLHGISNTSIFKIVCLKAEEDVKLKFLIATLIFLLAICEVSCACGRAEYLIGQECCPMCGPGYYVRRHCTEYTSTTCVPCPSLTFTEAPNGLESCRSCRICDPSAGLRVKRACTPSTDALCEPLEGHYCTESSTDGCQGAAEHTKCLPGQYIKEPGTANSDAVCEDCGAGTYSNGSLTSCRPHTQCDTLGLEVLKAGSSSQDTECGTTGSSVGIIVGVVIILLVGGGVTGGVIFHRRKKALTDNPVKYETKRNSNPGIYAQASQDPEVHVEDQQPDGLTGVT